MSKIYQVIGFLLRIIKKILVLGLIACFMAISIISFYGAFISEEYNAQVFSHHIMKEKVFKKDGKEIHLLGMVHVAEDYFYSSIKKDFSDEKFLVLIEGLKDEKNIMKNSIDYQLFASIAGLTQQPKGTAMFVRVKHADMDISELDPDFVAKMDKFFELVDAVKSGKREDIERINRAPVIFEDEFNKEALEKRNERLISVLDKEIIANDFILIPWGAAHLKEIEDHLEKKGFELTDVKMRPAINVVGSIIHCLYFVGKLYLNQ